MAVDPDPATELELAAEADRRARAYLAGIGNRRAFPDPAAIEALTAFDEPLPATGASAADTIAMLDSYGSPATVASNGPDYYGFVIGATLPVAAAAERLAIAWDQCASSFDNSPAADRIEAVAARWILEILDLPRASAVNFGTSATACGIACLAAARRELLARSGWDIDRRGLAGAPRVRVVVSELVHITVKKSLRVLGFGLDDLTVAPVDAHGRIDPKRLPPLDGATMICLQAGEVNTGEFDPFAAIVDRAREAGSWVHVDGAFGLWARASGNLRSLTDAVDRADSWTVDAHKWLNTPYDGAMAIVRDAAALAGAMNSDAAYSAAAADSQKNLGLEFSRRARGIAIWAALRSLGRDGVEQLVDEHCRLARRLAHGLEAMGFERLNRTCLNQVLVRLPDDRSTRALREQIIADGEIWFGASVWQGRPAWRLSLSSWRTDDAAIDRALSVIGRQLSERGIHGGNSNPFL